MLLKSNKNKRKQFTSNVFWAISHVFLRFFTQLAIIPVILTYWGSEKYSWWILINSVVGLIQVLNQGHLQYTGNKLNLNFHSQNEIATREIFGSTFKMLLIVVSIQLLSLIHI